MAYSRPQEQRAFWYVTHIFNLESQNSKVFYTFFKPLVQSNYDTQIGMEGVTFYNLYQTNFLTFRQLQNIQSIKYTVKLTFQTLMFSVIFSFLDHWKQSSVAQRPPLKNIHYEK